MNQTSRTILSSSSTHLFDELISKLKFHSFGFMNQVQQINYRIESRTIFKLVRFIVSARPPSSRPSKISVLPPKAM